MQTSIKTEKHSNPFQPSMNSPPNWLQTPSHSPEPMTKRLRPDPNQDQNQDQPIVHCPRCDSTHTKFCYYNNYSLSQPRYFCKSCRRYWTKGGTLRNIPIGGLSRKNKKLYHLNRRHHHQPQPNHDGNVVSRNSSGLQLSCPTSPVHCNNNLAEYAYPKNLMFDNFTIDFMEGGGTRENEGSDHFSTTTTVTNGFESGTGMSPFGEMMSYYDEHYQKMINGDDVKPRLCDFDLEWRDQMGCHLDLHGSGAGINGSSGYMPGFGSSWAGLMTGYGSSSTNSLV